MMGGNEDVCITGTMEGNISPSERFVRSGSEYKKIAGKLSDEMDRLMEMISPEAKVQKEIVDNLQTDLTMLSNEDIFIYAFRLGAKLMLDVLGEYKGQFYSPGE